MAKRGRKLKLNDDLIKKIVSAIEIGTYNKVAARAVGIDESTFYMWLKKGEEAKAKGINNIYSQFYDAVKEAESRAMIRHLSNIVKASQEGNWQASAWILERRYPELWGRKDRMNVETDNGIVVKIEKVNPEEVENG
jgi:hypothetical protein